jgi:hypothetical protein
MTDRGRGPALLDYIIGAFYLVGILIVVGIAWLALAYLLGEVDTLVRVR